MENTIIERVNPRLTEEELKMLEKARSMPITFDEDCPEVTPEQAIRFHRVNPVRKRAEF